MKKGSLYILKNKSAYIVPLTEKDLDGKALVLSIATLPNTVIAENQYIINANDVSTVSTINNTKKANEYIKSKGLIFFQYIQIKDEDLISTYVPSDKMKLGIGDSYYDGKKNKDYMVLGFFSREVSTDAVKANAPKVQRYYPYGVNLKEVMDYAAMVANSRDGVKSILISTPSGDVVGDTAGNTMSNMVASNSELAYWSIDMPKIAGIAYTKQEKPKAIAPPTTFTKVSTIAAGEKQDAYAMLTQHQGVSDDLFDLIKSNNNLPEKPNYNTFSDINYQPLNYPLLQNTGNIFFDKICLVNANDEEGQYANGGFFSDYSAIQYLAIRTDKRVLKEGDMISYVKLHMNCGKELDYAEYSKIVTTNEPANNLTAFGMSETPHIQRLVPKKTQFFTLPPIAYYGAGNFNCLQKHDQYDEKDKFGVGDVLKFKFSDILFLIYDSYIAYDKKGNPIVCYSLLRYNELESFVNGNTVIFNIYKVTKQYLYDQVEVHDGYFNERKIIKEFYLSGGSTSAASSKTNQFDELRSILGEEYDDTFLSAVNKLDWGRISDLQKKDPSIIEPIKEIVKLSYVNYLIERGVQPAAQIGKSDANVRKTMFTWETTKKEYYDNIVNTISNYVVNHNLPTDVALWYKSAFMYDGVAPAPSFELGEEKDIMRTLMGDGGSRNLEDFWFFFRYQHNLEPPIVLMNKYDSDYDYDIRVTNEYSLSGSFRFTRNEKSSTRIQISDDKDYFHGLIGDAIMYNLWRVHLCNNQIQPYSKTFPSLKEKQILPIVLTNVAIGQLKYANFFGIFQTPEQAYENIKVKIFEEQLTTYEIIKKNPLKNMFVSKSTSKVLSYEDKMDYFHDMLGRNNSNVTNYFYTEEGKKSFIDYFKSLPIEWGNIDAPYMQNMVIPATKTTKKRQPKAVTPTTDVFEWTTGLLDWGTQNMQKEFKQGYEITEKDFSIVYREFSITKNGQKREYRVLRFYPKIANKSNKYQKFSRDVYAEEVNVYKTDDLPNQHADLQSFVLHPNYDFSVIVPVDKVNEFNTKFMFPVLPVTTTTTEPFEWTGDWSDYSVNFPSLIDYFKSVLGITVNDFTIKNRPFTINTPTGKKEYFIFGYYPSNMPPNKEYEAYLQEVQDEETKYKTAPLYSLYKPLTEIAQGGEYDYTVIVPYDNVVDFMAKFVTGYKQSSTPPAPTSNFKWVDTPWNNFLRESYLKSFIEYYGGSADGQIVTASFRAGYPTVTDPQKEFFIVGFANAGAGKEYKELKLKLAKYANKIDVLALHDNYGNEFTDAVNNYQFEFDDLWFFDADDYLDIVDLLLYRGAGTTPPTTPPTPPTPPAPEPPKTKTTKPKTTITKEPKQPKPTKAASIKNKLDELDLDDI
jgi:hypothetical protein